jgi:hypothetical protein
VQAAQKRVVAAFAHTIERVRPDLAPRATPLAMLLFGMINWTFTWLRPGRCADARGSGADGGRAFLRRPAGGRASTART